MGSGWGCICTRLDSSACAAAPAAVTAPLTEKDRVVEAGAPNWSITLAVAEKLPVAASVCTAAGVKKVAPSENTVLYCRMKPSGSWEPTEQASTVLGAMLGMGVMVNAAVGGRSPGSPATLMEACELAPLVSVACTVI